MIKWTYRLVLVIKNFLSTYFYDIKSFFPEISPEVSVQWKGTPIVFKLCGGRESWGRWFVGSGEVPVAAPRWSRAVWYFTLEVAAFLVFKDSGILKGTSEMSEGFSQKPVCHGSNTMEWDRSVLASTSMLPYQVVADRLLNFLSLRFLIWKWELLKPIWQSVVEIHELTQ